MPLTFASDVSRQGGDPKHPPIPGPSIRSSPSVGGDAVELVETLRILLCPVAPDAFWPFPVRPLVHRRSVALEGHERDAVPARIGDPAHLDDDDRTDAHTRPAREPTRQVREGRSSARTARPVPCRRTMRGAPAKAQNITTIRPFSRRWAIVSTPLPVWSRYATVRSSMTTNSSRFPFGEQFTSPSRREWSGRHEEDRLCLEPLGETRIDDLVRPAHDPLSRLARRRRSVAPVGTAGRGGHVAATTPPGLTSLR